MMSPPSTGTALLIFSKIGPEVSCSSAIGT